MHLYINVLFYRESFDFRPKSHDICRTFKLSCWRSVYVQMILRYCRAYSGDEIWIRNRTKWTLTPVTASSSDTPELHTPKTKQSKFRGLSSRANYTDRATATCSEVSAKFFA
jgi:hypothetical protein